MAAALVVFWVYHGPIQEGEGWLDAALENHDGLSRALLARTLSGRAFVASPNFDAGTMAARSAEGIAVVQYLDDPGLLSRLLSAEGLAQVRSGQPGHRPEDAVALARRAGDSFALAQALTYLGIAHLMRNPPQARPYLEECVRVANAAGDVLAAVGSSATSDASCGGKENSARR